MASITWGREVAEAYDAASASMFDPAVLDPTVDFLAELARGGPALELAVGTGRVALPLSTRGVSVSGIELSLHMAEQLRAKPGADAVAVTIGDMTTTRLAGSFKLVYVVWNAIMNVTTQEEQVAVFVNAAAHLEPGGCFVVEVGVPEPHWRRPDELGRVFTMEDDHVGIYTYDDPVG
ncbi:MAG TPA: class I SAM-dependent methyltransferase, partial [Acidimicrobiales bacterium]|nr:class I SAM-dependent methyltransferase [Acidimicrobiales bacterium]